jgi:DoxX-like family
MPTRTTETGTETNVRNIVYWASTVCAAIAVGGAGAADLLHIPAVMTALAHLGYPIYFATILGTWELLGAAAILAPGLSRVKESAYAGMVFALSGAALSHAASGDPVAKILVPLVLLGAVLVSWTLRPARGTLVATESARPHAA